MKNISLGLRAFLEAAGVTAYVVVFALTVQNLQAWLLAHNAFPSPVLSIVLFLLAFVVSALICGSLVFLYPVRLFSAGQKKQALQVFLGSAVWLLVFLALFGVMAFLTL